MRNKRHMLARQARNKKRYENVNEIIENQLNDKENENKK